MTEISQLIKNLRNITGAGFLDCKSALIANQNNIDKAVEYLRKKGLSKVQKKSLREAKEGVVTINISNDIATIIEINTETDFAAKNSEFIEFVKKLNLIGAQVKKLEDFYELRDANNETVKDMLANIISKIGENVVIKKFEILNSNKDSKIYGYVHNKYDDNIGKIASLLKIQSTSFDNELNEIAKNICMHIAASKPIAVSIDDLDYNLVKKEKEILLANIKSTGKPDNIINNILEGKIKKFYEEVVLLEQKYIIDNEISIKRLFENFSKKKNIFPKITDFKLFILGN